MLPDWDFGGDEGKRRAFIDWVWAELDRFHELTIANDATSTPHLDWLHVFRSGAQAVPRDVGRPTDAFAGMNAMVWEFGLLRYLFRRYWPGKKRRLADPASAANIAVARCQRGLPADQRIPSRVAARSDLAHRVFEEWERGSRSPGRRQAERDIAYLDTLPAERFHI